MNAYADVWRIDEHAFPHHLGAADLLRFAASYAILAPSGHNGQPWRFTIEGDTLDVRADRTRALPTIDPDGRELLIACAATVHITRVALHHFGYRPVVRLLPDPTDADLLASIRLGDTGDRHYLSDSTVDRDLFTAVTARHCNRRRYRPRPLAADTIARLRHAARAEGAWLAVLTDRPSIAAAGDLIGQGDLIKWSDPAFRHELAQRLIPNRGRRRDGMPGSAFGIPGPLARLAPFAVRHLDLGRLRAASDRRLALATPALAIIGTDRDDPPAWLAAGQAMSHVLLRATADGLATSFLSQAIEVPELRPRLAALLDHPGHPQLLLRVGYPTGRPHLAPRRPLREVLTHTTAAREGARP